MNKKRECLSMLAMTKKSFAFTLAEVLIVLAVLGVIAAITIPTLIQDAREKALITSLKKNYTIFSQAVDMAVADNGSPNNWDIGGRSTTVGALKLYNILKPYLKIQEECGTKLGCFADHYGALFNESYTSQPATSGGVARGVLASGVSFHIYSWGTGCQGDLCGILGVDVNGKQGPNKAGVDYFLFYILTDELRPGGWGYGTTCQYKNSHTSNGDSCTWWVLKHENMDYLRKDGKYTNY